MEPRIVYCKPKLEYAASIFRYPFKQDVARSPSKEPEVIIVETPERALTPPDVDVMEAPSINSRQPPDGHEFPDYQEVTPIMSDKLPPRNPPQYVSRKDQQSSKSVRNMIAIFSNSTEENVPDGEPNDGLNKKGLSKSVMNINTIPSSLPSYYPPTSTPNHSVNRASLDISLSPPILPEKELANLTPTPRLHMRSQSLIDISDPKTKSTTDRWSLLVEQRRKGLSKLKGLIIPEHTDPDENAAIIDLPEIKSTTIPILPQIETKPLANFQIPNHSRNSSTSSIIWNTESSPAISKYSPAFKRKSLQVYGTKSESLPNDKKSQKQTLTSQIDDECRLPVTLSINDAPKSLESITSPTRSDCSFEYISSSPEPKGNNTHTKFHADPRRSFRPKEDAGKSEDESDNDSAVSSSQSSYISRNSPPASPNPLQSQHYATPRLEGKYELTGPDLQSSDRRLLKPQSVEAINRKNILASAKCRSGRDLKVGSPLIQRKFDEADTKPPEYTPPAPPPPAATPTAEPVRKTDKPPPETNGVALRPKETNNKEKETKQRPATLREPLDNNKILPRSLSRNNGSASVTDLRKNFEKLTTGAPTPASQPTATTPTKINPRLSVSYTSAPVVPTPAKRNSLPIIQPPPVVTKIINNADDTKIIEDVLKDLNETVNKDEIRVITLAADVPGGSIGITLAGGADYETKEITVHKVRSGSVAFRDGRLQKGERILAINGRSLKGVTHAESIAILKEPVAEVVLVACAATKESPSPALTPSSRHGSSFDLSVTTAKELPATTPGKKRDEVVVSLTKDAAGLGFSMEGGKDSPQGDVPLVIKKLFTGGIADKSGRVHVGDELVEINGVDVSAMPRIDVWTLMKKLPVGEVVLKVRR